LFFRSFVASFLAMAVIEANIIRSIGPLEWTLDDWAQLMAPRKTADNIVDELPRQTAFVAFPEGMVHAPNRGIHQ
jgi:hypothetical protein